MLYRLNILYLCEFFAFSVKYSRDKKEEGNRSIVRCAFYFDTRSPYCTCLIVVHLRFAIKPE